MKIKGHKSDRYQASRELNEHPLLFSSPAGIDRWVDDNVTDLESAKDALKLLARAVALTAKRSRRRDQF